MKESTTPNVMDARNIGRLLMGDVAVMPTGSNRLLSPGGDSSAGGTGDRSRGLAISTRPIPAGDRAARSRDARCAPRDDRTGAGAAPLARDRPLGRAARHAVPARRLDDQAGDSS